MAWVGSTVTTQVLGLLSMPQGLNACVATLAQALNTTATPLAGSQLAGTERSDRPGRTQPGGDLSGGERLLREDRESA